MKCSKCNKEVGNIWDAVEHFDVCPANPEYKEPSITSEDIQNLIDNLKSTLQPPQ